MLAAVVGAEGPGVVGSPGPSSVAAQRMNSMYTIKLNTAACVTWSANLITVFMLATPPVRRASF